MSTIHSFRCQSDSDLKREWDTSEGKDGFKDVTRPDGGPKVSGSLDLQKTVWLHRSTALSCAVTLASWPATVSPESSAARESVSPYSNSRFGDSMELCEEQKHTYLHLHIIVRHWSQLNHRCPDTHMHKHPAGYLLFFPAPIEPLVCTPLTATHFTRHPHKLTPGSFTVSFSRVEVWLAAKHPGVVD